MSTRSIGGSGVWIASSTKISAESSTAITSSLTTLTLDGDSSGDALAVGVPDECVLSTIVISLTALAGGAANLTYFLSADAAGNIPITNSTTTAITIGKTSATTGGVAGLLNVPYSRFSAGSQGKLYLQVKTDAGSANAIARLTWQTGS